MPTREEICGSLLKYLKAEHLEDGGPGAGFDTPLISGGIIDSFSVVSLRRFAENEFGILIPDARVTPEAFDSIARIAALVAELLGGKR